MGVFTNTFSNSLVQQGSLLNQIPNKSDALFWLDGLVVTEGENKYFRDKTANNRKFLITGYDFDATWLAGMPYKSAATISAPVGDATLIAADLNNYLYTAGVPNQIPVVSLFQDVDYEHRLFCRHYDQVLDANGVEIQEARVFDIVLYNTVKVGCELTNCQNYFKVPVESLTAKWVGAGKTHATIQLAMTAASDGDTIYVKTGLYDETTYLTINKAVNIICTGKTTITSSGTTSVVYFNRKNAALKNAIIDCESDTTNAITVNSDTVGSSNIELSRCLFSNIVTNVFLIQYGHALSLNYCVMARATTWTSTLYQGTVNSCYFKNGTITFGHANDTDTYLYNVRSINSKLINLLAGANSTFKIEIGVFTFTGNKFDTNSIAITQTQRTMAVARGISVSYNIFTFKNNSSNTIIRAIDLNTTLSKYSLNIHHNKFYCTEAINAGNSLVPINVINHLTYIENNLFDIHHPNHSVINISFSADDINKAFKVNNNYIYTETQSNTGISIGGESIYTNCNNGSEITGNHIIGTNLGSSSLHGMLISSGINNKIARNKVVGCGFGIVVKTGDTAASYTSEGVYSNLIYNCAEGIRTRGVSALNIFNNTIKDSSIACVKCDENSVIAGDQFSENIIIKNNILYNSTSVGSLILFDAHAAANGCIAENNQLFGGQYLLSDGTNYSDLATAQAANKLLNCVVGDPLLDASLVPQTPITGVDLGVDYGDGLDISTEWGEIISIVTKQQSATWQKGAYIQ